MNKVIFDPSPEFTQRYKSQHYISLYSKMTANNTIPKTIHSSPSHILFQIQLYICYAVGYLETMLRQI